VIRTVVPPSVGQAFIDEDGICWSVRKVINSPSLPGFFLVRLENDQKLADDECCLVLAPSEYEALLRSRGFKAAAPELASSNGVQAKLPASRGLSINFADGDGDGTAA
jgi:hypothetical protein